VRRKKLSSLLSSKDEQKRIREALKDPDELSPQDALKILKVCSTKGAKKKGGERGERDSIY
jgi:hypothetical protein